MKHRVISCLCLPGLLAAAGALLLAACGSSSNSSTKASKTGPIASTMVVNQAGVPATLDPNWAEGGEVDAEEVALYGTLFTYTSTPAKVAGTYEGKLGIKDVKGRIAESYAFSNDDKTITLKIRPGLKFPSGEAVNAHAVVWTIKAIIRSQGGLYSNIEEEQHDPPLIKSVTASGPLTVVMKYSRSAPTQPLVLTNIPVYDPALVEAHGGIHKGVQNKWIASHAAGYGPYLIKSYRPGHQLVLEANPTYFEPAKTKKLIINFISDTETLLLDAKSGAADITTGLSLQAAHSLVGNSCCTVASFKGPFVQELNFPDFSSSPAEFRNKYFREALSYAVPYEGILKKVAYGWGELFYGEWEPSFSWYDPSIGKPREYNLAKAKELLKKSGIKTPVSFPFYVESSNIQTREIATAVQAAWAQIGVNAKVEQITTAQFQEEAYSKHAGITLMPDSTVEVAPAYLWSWDLQCKSAYNATGVCIPAADKIMKEIADGVYIDNPTKEQELLDEVDKMYIDDAPRVWVYSYQTVVVMKKGVTNLGAYSYDLRLFKAYMR